MKEKVRLEFSNVELSERDMDWEVRPLKDFYLIKLLNFANEIGLKGKKIKEIVRITPVDFSNRIYIDFICA